MVALLRDREDFLSAIEVSRADRSNHIDINMSYNTSNRIQVESALVLQVAGSNDVVYVLLDDSKIWDSINCLYTDLKINLTDFGDRTFINPSDKDISDIKGCLNSVSGLRSMRAF